MNPRPSHSFHSEEAKFVCDRDKALVDDPSMKSGVYLRNRLAQSRELPDKDIRFVRAR